MQLLAWHAKASCLLQVLSWGADAMRWLYSTAQHSPDQQTLVVEAFAAWVRLGLLYEQELPQTEVHGLLSLTFQALLHSSEGKQCVHTSAKGHSLGLLQPVQSRRMTVKGTYIVWIAPPSAPVPEGTALYQSAGGGMAYRFCMC